MNLSFVFKLTEVVSLTNVTRNWLKKFHLVIISKDN